MIFLSLIIMLGVYFATSMKLKVLNPMVLEQRLSNTPLKINLEVSSDAEKLTLMYNILMICYVKNGRSCFCSSDLEEGLPSTCFSSESYLFSIILKTSTSEPQASSALRIANKAMNLDCSGSQISVILPLTFDDISRAFVTLESFIILADPSVICVMYIVCPDTQLASIKKILVGTIATLKFPVKVLSEVDIFMIESKAGGLKMDSQTISNLIHRSYSYAIQMAIKLIISRLITTDFYLTLDADVVLLQSFSLLDLVSSGRRAVYHHEGRYEAHPDWWEGSEQFLGIDSRSKLEQGFGVTPALLSTYGSLLTLEYIRDYFFNSPQKDIETNYLRQWLWTFGITSKWSEYTLYRIVLDHLKVKYSIRK